LITAKLPESVMHYIHEGTRNNGRKVRTLKSLGSEIWIENIGKFSG